MNGKTYLNLQKHFKLVDNSPTVWVYGSDEAVDRTLRFA